MRAVYSRPRGVRERPLSCAEANTEAPSADGRGRSFLRSVGTWHAACRHDGLEVHRLSLALPPSRRLAADTDPARASRCGAGSLWSQGQRLGDAPRLVLDPQGNLLQFVCVLFAVVHTEEKVEATGQGDAYVRLGPAPITTIGGVQCGAFDDLGAHGRPRFLTSSRILSVVSLAGGRQIQACS